MRIALACLIVAACGGPHDPPASKAVVTLRDAGAEPRHVVRYAPKLAKRRLRVTSDEARTAFVVDVEVTSSAPIRARYKGVQALLLDPRSGEQPDAQLGEILQRAVGTIIADPQGRASANFDSSVVHTTPSLPAAFTLVIATFPAEPIGVGARWHVDGLVIDPSSPPIALDFVASAVDADSATITYSGKQDTVTVNGITTLHTGDLIPTKSRYTNHMPKNGDFPEMDFTIVVE